MQGSSDDCGSYQLPRIPTELMAETTAEVEEEGFHLNFHSSFLYHVRIILSIVNNFLTCLTACSVPSTCFGHFIRHTSYMVRTEHTDEQNTIKIIKTSK